MITFRSSYFGVALILLACGDAKDASPHTPGGEPENSATQDPSDPKLELPALAAGFQRLMATSVDVPAKSSDDWAQWVGGPLDQDQDVIAVTGGQSKGGHHAVLYATTASNPPGFTRKWQDEDQLKTRMMGGVGGEGGTQVDLPPGFVFRVKKGSYLLLQTHYLNASDVAMRGRSFVDVKLAPVNPSNRVVSLMSNANLSVMLPPGKVSTQDVTCPVATDLSFLQISNHMHDHGKQTFTEVTVPSGETRMLKKDDNWQYAWALSPNYEKFAVDKPLVVPAGSVLHTRCTWENKTSDIISFPAEMCVFFGFIVSDTDIACTDGKWLALGASLPASDAGSLRADDAGAASDAGTAGDAGAAGACVNSKDRDLMNAAQFEQQKFDCSASCGLDPDIKTCTTPCFSGTIGLSSACAACNAAHVACGASNCFSACLTDSASAPCRSCVANMCGATFKACTGL